MSSVFLSHSHDDKTFVRKLARDLRKRGHIVWIDEAEIQVGESLIEKISDGIDRVDFVVVALSQTSVKSEWVKRELDVAINRELKERRVIVLPILLDKVELPSFLVGKKYADFSSGRPYHSGLQEILRALGPAESAPPPTDDMLAELDLLRRKVAQHERDIERRVKLAALRWSEKLQQAIIEENAKHPEWAHINNAYAFEAMGAPVTVGYALHSMRKASITGHSALELALQVDEKWPEFRTFAEAIEDYFQKGDNETS